MPCINLIEKSLDIYDMDSKTDYRLLVFFFSLLSFLISFLIALITLITLIALKKKKKKKKKKTKMAGSCYLSPPSSDNKQKFEALWDELSKGDGHEDIVEHTGREVMIPQAAHG